MRYVPVVFTALLLSACSSMGHWMDNSSGGSNTNESASSWGMMHGTDGSRSGSYNYSTMQQLPGDTYFGS